MNVHTWLLGVAYATVLLWLIGAALTLRGMMHRKPLVPIDDEHLLMKDVPLVSILVPARNEEHRVLRVAIQSMLEQDYPNFEVIVVNDRSTDRTGTILNLIAQTNKKLTVIEGVEPPAGWLGKPHAMQQALQASQGAWVLATDADMIFAPSVVHTAVSHALKGGYDAVTLIPHVRCLSFWERVFMPTFGWFMLLSMPIDRVNDPRRSEALGIGGFFLMRRESLNAVGGYVAVRAEVAEDLRMAERLKSSGARLRAEYAPDLIQTRMQTSFSEIWEGFTKNLFAGAKFSVLQTTVGAAAVLLFAVAPPIIAGWCLLMIAIEAPGRWIGLFVPTFLVWIVQVAIFAVINKSWNIPTVHALTAPLGYLLFVLILLNSAVKILTGSGVTWKGRRVYEPSGVRPPRAL